MFDTLLKRLKGAPSTEPLAATDARLAMAALMVRVARADHDYAPEEVAIIDNLLANKYNLDTEGTATLRAEAEKLEAEAPDTVRFTRLIKDAVPYEDRNAVVENLWRIVLADDVRDDQENGFLHLVSHLLGVTDKDSAIARQKAAKTV